MAGVSANQTPAEQEHVFGAYADPKALKNRQNEIIQNGGVKAGFGKAEEVPKIPARHSAQEMEQHYAAPENSVQQPVQQMEGEISSKRGSQAENEKKHFDIEFHNKKMEEPYNAELTQIGRARQKHNNQSTK
ncbi:hypothetical protein FAI41_04325 [Acetobacteraceae bacterium]|nr:hypothetical protein FAI41_04325 [Acetobacteraceae bacterium]